PMSTSIEQAFVKHFQADVHMAYQRMGSKLRSTIRSKNNIRGASTVFQKVGQGTASTKSRHGQIPVMNLNREPVECHLADYYAGHWTHQPGALKPKPAQRDAIAT